jgi:hypothetical protein
MDTANLCAVSGSKKFKRYLIKLFIGKALPNLSYNGKS